MPIPGLSLVGFMQPHEAAQYFTTACLIHEATPASLNAYWQNARDQLGEPIANAGRPGVLPITSDHNQYLERVERNPRFSLTVGEMSWSFRLVEITPLLSFQFHIALEQAQGRWHSRIKTPTLAQMLRKCLPLRPDHIQDCQLAQSPGQLAFQIQSPNLNMGAVQAKFRTVKGRRVATLTYELGIRSPFVQVIHVDGRYYLRNGFHRAYALGRLGISHIPCILLEPRSYDDAGLAPGFARHLLDSNNPPTCGHFILNRAYPVTLRRLKRVTEIVCSEYAVPAE